mmetsp:Transcript_19401/g.39914  ORF Transcript_19401/g.39914 Transcript_19401/m.39914 type:complete len:631 (-) Transcript_19401:1613-3505(-)|eukprot:CAMPEP_0201127428 /NCGR_PEP_ID=MMETSP0850-20130426/30278_1 /ASSEMBLY_ACC=CAM_ASM_000622 /TAXON_ID=183588 /ORGANISM="Pseudo-nitzschia fraudulenta, Strain WWA7" /LENGTH=630 /DNA_ID=CAMNT_0047396283 /DNA_START=81 /DNA_END=1973 /DNA_ORIENTATION=+
MGSTTACAIGLAATSIGLVIIYNNCNDDIVVVPSKKFNDQGYNLKPVSSPVLSGLSLAWMARMAHLPVVGPVVFAFLKQKNDISAPRKLAAVLKEMPLYYPLPELSPEVKQRENDLASDFCVEKFASVDHDVALQDPAVGFRHWTIRDYTTRYAAGEVSPVNVARAVIAAIEDSNRDSDHPLMAMTAMHRDDVMQQAYASLERYRNGVPKGVLDGIPIAIKDGVDVLGYSTSAGTSFLGTIRGVATVDSDPVARLRNAGALIIGKTNQHEIGLGTTGYNRHFKTPRNPYNLAHYTGGSSSGSAALVAAGIVPVAIGVDGGGSIRIPAALCGVVGLKPTFKRIAMDFTGLPSVAHMGPIAGTVKDAALAYAVMAGPRDGDAQSQRQPDVHVGSFSDVRDLRGVRLGIFRDHWASATPDIQRACQNAVDLLESLGAEVHEITIPHMHETHLAHSITILSEMAEHHDRYHSEIREFSYETQISIGLGRSLSSRDFLAAQRIRNHAMKTMARIFTTVDAIVSPSTGLTAPRFEPALESQGESNLSQTAALMRFIVHGNFVGIPGIAVPVGYDANDLPISLQFQASHWNENLILRLAKATEGIVPNGIKKPGLYYSILDQAHELKASLSSETDKR